MDLSDFLLARIEEDVDVLTRPESFQHSSHGYDSPGTYSPTCRTCRQFVWGTRERALAECAAKRRIVAECQDQRREFDRRDTTDGWPDQTAALMGDAILALLALPYAAHPDYDEAWRP